MKEASQINQLIKQVDSYVQNCPENVMEYKAFPHKWSKKEILGHLVDSAIHNLQRFVEIQFSPSVYSVHPYRQNEWVNVNDYQNTDTQSLLQLWMVLNQRIVQIISTLDEDTVDIPIFINDHRQENLAFLISDYVVHMGHHVKQIVE